MKMKKIVLLLIAIFLVSTPCFPADKNSFKHDISVDDSKTNAVMIPDWAKYVGVIIPTLDAGAVGIEVYESGSTAYQDISAAALLASADIGWYPVLDIADGADAEICASGNPPGYVDITPFLGALRNVYVRFTVGAQTTGDTTWYLYWKE